MKTMGGKGGRARRKGLKCRAAYGRVFRNKAGLTGTGRREKRKLQKLRKTKRRGKPTWGDVIEVRGPLRGSSKVRR